MAVQALSGACAVKMLAADADAESETAPMSAAPSAVTLLDSKAATPAAARSSRSTTRLRPIRQRPPHFCHLGSASMLAALVCAIVALVLQEDGASFWHYLTAFGLFGFVGGSASWLGAAMQAQPPGLRALWLFQQGDLTPECVQQALNDYAREQMQQLVLAGNLLGGVLGVVFLAVGVRLSRDGGGEGGGGDGGGDGGGEGVLCAAGEDCGGQVWIPAGGCGDPCPNICGQETAEVCITVCAAELWQCPPRWWWDGANGLCVRTEEACGLC